MLIRAVARIFALASHQSDPQVNILQTIANARANEVNLILHSSRNFGRCVIMVRVRYKDFYDCYDTGSHSVNGRV